MAGGEGVSGGGCVLEVVASCGGEGLLAVVRSKGT